MSCSNQEPLPSVPATILASLCPSHEAGILLENLYIKLVIVMVATTFRPQSPNPRAPHLQGSGLISNSVCMGYGIPIEYLPRIPQGGVVVWLHHHAQFLKGFCLFYF